MKIMQAPHKIVTGFCLAWKIVSIISYFNLHFNFISLIKAFGNSAKLNAYLLQPVFDLLLPNRLCLSLCLSVCFSLNKIIQKFVKDFDVKCSGTVSRGPGKNDFIFFSHVDPFLLWICQHFLIEAVFLIFNNDLVTEICALLCRLPVE